MDRLTRAAWGALSVATLLVGWWLAGLTIPEVVPGVRETLATLVVVVTTPGPYGHPFYYHVYKTVEMIFLSLVVSIGVGTVLGVALGTTSRLESAISAWIYGWLAVPSLVIVFVSAIWLGFRVRAGYFAVPVVITPFVVLNMWEGARNLDPQLSDMATFFGAGRYLQFREVVVPQLVPFLFASVRSALSIGWKITLLVEAFLLTRGVGFMFKRSFDNYDLTTMMSWLLIFVVFLVVVEYGFVVPLHRRVTHWRPDVEGVRVTEG